MIGYTLRRLVESLADDGVETTIRKIFYRVKRGKLLVHEKYCESEYGDPDRIYQIWREKNRLSAETLAEMKKKSEAFAYRPLISIVMPTYKCDRSSLEKAIQSVLQQCYPIWQLCICDDHSDDPFQRKMLENYVQGDSRIICQFKDKNEGIVATSQKSAALAAGEFLAFMDQDDLLSEEALYRVVEKLNERPDLDLIYSDNDKVDMNEVHREVFFKPDYSPDEFFCHNYIGHLSVLRKSVFDEIGGFMPGFDGAQDFDLLLRAVEKTDRIAHLPYVLYSWRRSRGSTASSPTAKHYAYESGKKALQEFCRRNAIEAAVEETGERGLYRCRFAVRNSARVSVIIPQSEPVQLERCLKNIFEKTVYENYEVIIVGKTAESMDPEKFGKYSFKFLPLAGDPNLSQMMNAGRVQATGDYLLFLHGDTEVIHPDWLRAMLEPIQRKQVGIVGAKLLSSDGTIQHGGVVFGLGGLAGYALRGVPENAVIYEQPHYLIRNCSAVSGACMLTNRAVFDSVNGFDEHFDHSYYDLDFCLRARQKGYWIVWTPFARLQHQESCSQSVKVKAENEKLFRNRWKDMLSLPDPFYSINLTRRYFDFTPHID